MPGNCWSWSFHSQVKHDGKLAEKLQELVTPNAADEVGVRIQPANYCRIGGALTRQCGKSRSGLDSWDKGVAVLCDDLNCVDILATVVRLPDWASSKYKLVLTNQLVVILFCKT